MITMTDTAIERVKALMVQNHKEGYGLRIGVVGGGCSGMSYQMDLVEQPSDKDKVLEMGGVRVFIDPKASLYLQGIEIGYHSDMMSSSFVFKNPNAKTTCGCGTSFGV